MSELCASVTTLSHIHLRYLYCYACSPHEPKSTNASRSVISICPEFAEQLDPAAYDNCGLAIPGERGNICAGDDIVSVLLCKDVCFYDIFLLSLSITREYSLHNGQNNVQNSLYLYFNILPFPCCRLCPQCITLQMNLLRMRSWVER